MKKLVGLSLTVLLVAPHAAARPRTIDARQGCRGNPAVVGECFEVDGTAYVANGSPNVRIRRARTGRVLGVIPAESEIAPRCLLDELSFERDVVGRFTVCPITPEKRGEMQLVCVEAVSGDVTASGNPSSGKQKVKSLRNCRFERDR